MKKTDITILGEAMLLLSDSIESQDGVANMAIREAGERILELRDCLVKYVPMQCRKDIRFHPENCRTCTYYDVCNAFGGYEFD